MRGQPSIIVQAERIVREHQLAQGEGVTIPTWLVAGLSGFFAGMVLGPSLMAATKEGSEALAELSRKYVGR